MAIRTILEGTLHKCKNQKHKTSATQGRITFGLTHGDGGSRHGYALAGLGGFVDGLPGPSAQAITMRAFGPGDDWRPEIPFERAEGP